MALSALPASPGATPEAPDVYSPVLAGWVSPGRFQETRAADMGAARGKPGAYAKAATYGEQIRAELAANNPGLLVLDREFETQSVDPMFLEPESGLGWYDRAAKTSSSCSACSRHSRPPKALAFMLGNARAPFKPARIKSQFAYMGGGFGGRDHTPFPLYVALAAMFFPGRPVRLAHDRYQQFQGGIKRHAFKMRTRIGVDRASGKITAFAADHVLDGGGLANFSASVATVSATAAIGIYDIPKVDVTTVALHSRGVTAGSMRGYGTLQTMTALEVLIDEAAAALPLDPIEFRRRNALKTGGKTMTGNPYSVSIRTPEILDKLERHPIWRQRPKRKRAGSKAGSSSAPASPAPPRITAPARTVRWDAWKSTRRAGLPSTAITSRWATASGRRLPTGWRPHLGGVADEVTVHGSTPMAPLALVTSGNPYTMDQATQDAAAKNPRWVPAISTATVASNGAHVGTQAAAEAARVIFRFGLWPAALELWGIAPTDPTAKEWEAARWKDGQLVDAGPGAAVVAHDRRQGTCAQLRDRGDGARLLPLGVVAGDLPHRAGEPWTADIDALAVRKGGGKYARLDRTSVKFPPTDNNRIGTVYTALCATLVRIEIDARHRRVCASPKPTACFECGQRAGAGNRPRASARRLCHGRRLCVARNRCRLTRAGPATGNGISDNTSSRAGRTCRCAISRSRCCRR